MICVRRDCDECRHIECTEIRPNSMTPISDLLALWRKRGNIDNTKQKKCRLRLPIIFIIHVYVLFCFIKINIRVCNAYEVANEKPTIQIKIEYQMTLLEFGVKSDIAFPSPKMTLKYNLNSFCIFA